MPLATTVDHTAAYFALAGALGGSLLTLVGSYLVSRRQTASERERLERQLEHDRELRDLDDLRKAMAEATDFLERLQAQIEKLLVSSGSDRWSERTLMEATRIVQETMRAGLKLALWLPREHAVIAAFGDVERVVKALRDALVRQRLESDADSAESRRADALAERIDFVTKQGIELGRVTARFVIVAQRHTGARTA